MDNIENTNMQEEQTADQQDAFLGGWDDEQTAQEVTETEETAEDKGTTDEETGTASETEGAQGAAEGGAAETAAETGTETQTETTEQKADAPEKTWELRHLDETKSVGEAEMVALAQKGMDYDRIRTKYDESKPAMEMLAAFAKEKGVTVAEYIAYLRTEAKKADGLSEAEAKRSVELEDREAAVAAREAEQQAERSAAERAEAEKTAKETSRKADIDEFTREYPDAAKDPNKIPQEVWEAVSAGSRLVVAYAKYLAKQAGEAAQQAKAEAAATKQNSRNAQRATGSMQSAGADTGKHDPFLEGFGG